MERRKSGETGKRNYPGWMEQEGEIETLLFKMTEASGHKKANTVDILLLGGIQSSHLRRDEREAGMGTEFPLAKMEKFCGCFLATV